MHKRLVAGSHVHTHLSKTSIRRHVKSRKSESRKRQETKSEGSTEDMRMFDRRHVAAN
jgi:hypothetical protein